MNTKGQLSRPEKQIQSALGNFLKARKNGLDPDAHQGHLDDDLLTAFVEGNLNENEAKPVVSHLADCSYCLHVSAQLIKLDLEFAEEPRAVRVQESEPASVGAVLSGILEKIFGSNDAAVFAHEEKESESDDPGDEGRSES